MARVFDWDDNKSRENERKHKVSFEEAITVFDDPFVVTIDDATHSIDEQRLIDIETSSEGRILVVVYTELEEQTRIISCRKVTPFERRIYEERY